MAWCQLGLYPLSGRYPTGVDMTFTIFGVADEIDCCFVQVYDDFFGYVVRVRVVQRFLVPTVCASVQEVSLLGFSLRTHVRTRNYKGGGRRRYKGRTCAY